MSVFQTGLLYMAATFALLFSGMPIAFAIGAVALLFMFFFMPATNLTMIAETVFGELNNFTLLTIPLFVLMGSAIGKSRAGADLYNSLHRWLCRIPGGLGVANVVGCSIFAAMSGSSPATCSAIGSTGIPEMRKRGYTRGLSASIIAAGGTLGILLPPSVTLILYGLAAEQSIGRLFMAGIGPGLLLTLLFVLYTVFKYRQDRVHGRHQMDADTHLADEQYTWKERVETLPRLLPFMLLLGLIMVGLYGGLATPSEVAGLGCVGALIMVCVVYGSWRWSQMKLILTGAMRESSMIMLIIGMSLLYSYVMSYLHVTQSSAEWLVSLPLSKWVFFFWVTILIIVLGFFLPPVAIILMVVPIILPAMRAHGFNLVWFGIVMSLIMETGLIHPPVGLNLFVIKGIAPDIPLKDIIWGVLPFIGLMLVAIVLLAVFPEIATWLPDHVYKGA